MIKSNHLEVLAIAAVLSIGSKYVFRYIFIEKQSLLLLHGSIPVGLGAV